MEQKLQGCKVAVSACLNGSAVRYDASDKPHDFVCDILPHYCDVISICPESGAGMGVPRPPVQLIQRDWGVSAVGVEDASWEPGPQMLAYAQNIIPQLAGISGYVFKARSPSCSVRGVVVLNSQHSHPGLFAALLMQAMPELPVVEEEDVLSEAGQTDFLRRVHAYHRAHGKKSNT